MANDRKPAHEKKDSTAAGKFEERKQTANAAAPKQRWVPGKGWVRDKA